MLQTTLTGLILLCKKMI